MQILTISGSLRDASSNTILLRAVARLAPSDLTVVAYAGLETLPFFNPDLDVEGASLPPAVVALRQTVAAADALVISSPEYAHGVPGVLKNGLDWLVSDPRFDGKPVALLNASPQSTHAQASLEETLRTMSARLVPPTAVPIRAKGLTEEALVANPETAALIVATLERLRSAVATS